MKKLILFVFVIALAASSLNASVTKESKNVIGEWKYEVPTAPYGYEAGTMVISEKEGKLVGHVKFGDGYKINLKDVNFSDGILKCGLYVDYEYVSIKANIEGKEMSGAVDTPQGEMKISAKKIK